MINIKDINKAKRLVERYQVSLENLRDFTSLQKSEEYIPIIIHDPKVQIKIEGLEANRMMQEIIMVQLKHKANFLAYQLKDLGVNPDNPFEQEEFIGFREKTPPEEDHWENYKG